MTHPIENIMEKTMTKLSEMVDVNTIVGDPVAVTGESLVIPVSKVSVGFVAGGGEYSAGIQQPIKKAGEAADIIDGKHPFAGAAAAGCAFYHLFILNARGRLFNQNPHTPRSAELPRLNSLYIVQTALSLLPKAG